MRATIAGLGALAAAILLSGCLQLQINPVLDRNATIRHGKVEKLTISGTISCTRSEPVDVFPTFTQGSTTDDPESVNIPCGPGKPQPYTIRFEVTHGFVTGQIQAQVQYCTNPSVELNEDCVTITRVLTVVSPST